MRDNKGWDFLTAFEDIDEKYIYQAAKPWKICQIRFGGKIGRASCRERV